MGFGSEKYGDHNWLAGTGLAWSRLRGAMLRHDLLAESGEDIDPESGLLHLAHMAANALMRLEYALRNHGIDDRFKQERGNAGQTNTTTAEGVPEAQGYSLGGIQVIPYEGVPSGQLWLYHQGGPNYRVMSEGGYDALPRNLQAIGLLDLPDVRSGGNERSSSDPEPTSSGSGNNPNPEGSWNQVGGKL